MENGSIIVDLNQGLMYNKMLRNKIIKFTFIILSILFLFERIYSIEAFFELFKIFY